MNTFEEICGRIKKRLVYEASKLEGSWTADNVQAVANELARIYEEDIDTILDKAFLTTTYGEWADWCCGDYGVKRNLATHSTVDLQIVGTPGKYESMEFAADDIVFITETFVIPETGTGTVKAVCKVPGNTGNVLEGTINKIIGNRTKIRKVTNPQPAEGGYNTENDASLIARTLEKIQMPVTSGNIAHYRQWALENTGVEKVKVFPLARGKGTVDVVVIADGNTQPPPPLLEKIHNHIEENRPIGADVLIMTAEPVGISVSADIITAGGYSNEDIRQQFSEQLQMYLQALPFDNYSGFQGGIVSYLKVVDLLFNCDGVRDVSDYRINGMRNSIRLKNRQFPVLKNVTVTGGT